MALFLSLYSLSIAMKNWRAATGPVKIRSVSDFEVGTETTRWREVVGVVASARTDQPGSQGGSGDLRSLFRRIRGRMHCATVSSSSA